MNAVAEIIISVLAILIYAIHAESVRFIAEDMNRIENVNVVEETSINVLAIVIYVAHVESVRFIVVVMVAVEAFQRNHLLQVIK